VRTILIAAIAAVLASCNRTGQNAAPDAAQKANEPESLSVSHWTDKTELFMEYPALVAGQAARFAVHFTRLDTFKPMKSGKVEVHLEGTAGFETFSSPAPSRPGIFGVDVKPAKAGEYRMTVRVDAADLSDTHDLGGVTIYPDQAAASRHDAAKRQEETIAFLKEQQWALDFASEPTGERTQRASFVAPAEVRPRAGGQGEVTAPIEGRLVEAASIPPGQAVARGQVLARIAPPISAPDDRPALELAKAEAEGALQFARRDRERAQRLVEAGAAPNRRLEEARWKETAQEARLTAAEARLAQYETTREAEGDFAARSFSVRAPIAGTVFETRAVAGANVRPGDSLFRIVDTATVYIAASMPEAEAGKLRAVTGAELMLSDGRLKPLSKLISSGKVVDPVSRTVPVVYEVDNSDRQLAIGQAASVRLFTSANTTAPAVRESALVDDGGRPVIFVQLAGETFARRPVTLGNREGAYVQVTSGVKTGERVVTKGAYLIRLAALSTQIPAHGHVH
jgi:cobalt-zinc-cadmium efflux system membrane fusion protein